MTLLPLAGPLVFLVIEERRTARLRLKIGYPYVKKGQHLAPLIAG